MSKQIQHTVTYEDGVPCNKECKFMAPHFACGRSFAEGKYVRVTFEDIVEDEECKVEKYPMGSFYIAWKPNEDTMPHWEYWRHIENKDENISTEWYISEDVAREKLAAYRNLYAHITFRLMSRASVVVD